MADNMANSRHPADREDLVLADTIVIDGRVDWVRDVPGAPSDTYIGIVNMLSQPTFSGKQLTREERVAFTPEFADKIGWGGSAASVRFVFCPAKFDPSTIVEDAIMSVFGDASCEFEPVYSELSGYLWTAERFSVGGHDMLEIMRSHVGEWVHLEADIYRLAPRIPQSR